MRHQQHSFAGFQKQSDIFGGSLLTSNPKIKRPLDSKFATHVVLRAKRSHLRLSKTIAFVDQTVAKTCAKHGVRLYKYANVHNHLHLLIKLRNRNSWSAFIRELTGRIAQKINVLTHQNNLWEYRPFTRIVRGWRRAFKTAKEYVYLNWLEGEGRINRKQSRTLRELRVVHGERPTSSG